MSVGHLIFIINIVVYQLAIFVKKKNDNYINLEVHVIFFKDCLLLTWQ